MCSSRSYASFVPLAVCRLIFFSITSLSVLSATFLRIFSRLRIFFAISFESNKPKIAKIMEISQTLNEVARSFTASSFTLIARLSIA